MKRHAGNYAVVVRCGTLVLLDRNLAAAACPHLAPRRLPRLAGFRMSGVDMAFFGRPDPLLEATADRYEAEVRQRMAKHAATNPREPGKRLVNANYRLALRNEIDGLLDAWALARAVLDGTGVSGSVLPGHDLPAADAAGRTDRPADGRQGSR